MSDTLMLIISMAACLLYGIIVKAYMQKAPDKPSVNYLFNATSSAVVTITLLIMGGFGEASVFTVILGILFGISTALHSVTKMIAINIGPLSYTTVIISFSTVISALSGVMFFGESIGWSQIVGIVLMLASFIFASKSECSEKGANLKWLIFCLFAFITSGGIGIMQKVHQSGEYKSEINAFLIISFITMSVMCTAVYLALYMREKKEQQAAFDDSATTVAQQVAQRKKMLILLLITVPLSGVCIALNNKFNLYLSGVIDSAVFFPLVNGGNLVLTTLAALIVFKERLTRGQWIGVILGTLSVIFLCNPFG